jgi:hypothetical protein
MPKLDPVIVIPELVRERVTGTFAPSKVASALPGMSPVFATIAVGADAVTDTLEGLGGVVDDVEVHWLFDPAFTVMLTADWA